MNENFDAWLDVTATITEGELIRDNSASTTWIYGNRIRDNLITTNIPFLQSIQGEAHPMKTLYEVTVVSIKEEILLDGKKVVAENEDEAKFLADVSEVLKSKTLKPSDVTIICKVIGQVRVEEKPKKVEIVK